MGSDDAALEVGGSDGIMTMMVWRERISSGASVPGISEWQ